MPEKLKGEDLDRTYQEYMKLYALKQNNTLHYTSPHSHKSPHISKSTLFTTQPHSTTHTTHYLPKTPPKIHTPQMVSPQPTQQSPINKILEERKVDLNRSQLIDFEALGLGDRQKREGQMKGVRALPDRAMQLSDFSFDTLHRQSNVTPRSSITYTPTSSKRSYPSHILNFNNSNNRIINPQERQNNQKKDRYRFDNLTRLQQKISQLLQKR